MKFSENGLREGIIPNQFWIKIDIYGNGAEWYLAIVIDHDMLRLPQEDFESFFEEFEGKKIEPIHRPPR